MKAPAFIEANVRLAAMTTFGIGGPARWLARPADCEQVEESLAFAKHEGLPVLMLGGGSNVLVADAGVEAVVIRLGQGGFSRVEMLDGDPLRWRVGAAAGLQTLVRTTVERGVRGLEPLAGIPGRVGGAVAMNCGGGDDAIGDFVRSAEVYDAATGMRTELTGASLDFSYRHSGVMGRLAVGFTLEFSERGDPGQLADRMREFRERKKAGQPLMVPSAGCMFKNPPGDAAGALLDAAGCKLMREGGAEVSGLHANFIINQANASSGDVARLAARMRDAVYRRGGVTLESEIILWGDDPAFDELRRRPE